MSLLVTYAAATGLVTAGVGTVASIIGGGCSGAVATMYVGAYNDCENHLFVRPYLKSRC